MGVGGLAKTARLSGRAHRHHHRQSAAVRRERERERETEREGQREQSSSLTPGPFLSHIGLRPYSSFSTRKLNMFSL